MGRKQKIIPHVPGTMDSIVESFFAKDKYLKKKEEPTKRNEKKDETKPSQKSK